MKKITCAAVAALVALSVGSAGASERHHARRHVQQQGVVTGDPRNAFDFEPAFGQARAVPGVYPGQVYGGATSAPAGR